MQFHMESRWYVHKVLSLSHGESDDILLENKVTLEVGMKAFFSYVFSIHDGGLINLNSPIKQKFYKRLEEPKRKLVQT